MSRSPEREEDTPGSGGAGSGRRRGPSGGVTVALLLAGFVVVGAAVFGGGVLIGGRLGQADAASPGPYQCQPNVSGRCMGATTSRDFVKPLQAQGFGCAVAYRPSEFVETETCDREVGLGDGAVEYRVTVMFLDDEARVSQVRAEVYAAAPGPAARPLFELLAPIPLARDRPMAQQATSWVKSAMDGRKHQSSIGGYQYAVDASSGVPRLTIDAGRIG